MNGHATDLVRHDRRWRLVWLLGLATGAWVVLVWQMAGDQSMPMGPVLFLVTWLLMMVAMMFPSAAPMILTFSRLQAARRQRGQAFIPAWVFVAGYLAVWTAFGVLALGASWLAEAVGLMGLGGPIGGVLLVLAGLYQFSPLKHTCLARCRTPLGFLLTFWRDGYAGAFRMGLAHGVFCLGCCWLLFVLLFPLGLMNLLAMAALTLVIFAEKVLPAGPWIGRAAGLGLAGWGLLSLALSGWVPSPG